VNRPSSAEIEIMRNLFASPSGSIDLYELHEEFLLSSGQLANVCRRMAEFGVLEIEMEDGFPTLLVTITPTGRQWVVRHRKRLFLTPSDRPWAVAIRETSQRLDLFAPFLPTKRRPPGVRRG